jgi:hypothetical protein
MLLNKRDVRKLAQELVALTEHAATGLWLLTNDAKSKLHIKTAPGRALNKRGGGDARVSPALLGRPISEFEGLPGPHEVNVTRGRKKRASGEREW